MKEPIRILLADDHALMRKGVRDLLEAEADLLVVGEAADGQQAIDLTLALRPDVVLMDIRMPVLNGVQATRRLQVDAPEVKVVALSAYDDTAYVFGLLDAGAAGYVLKSSDARTIVRAVRDAYRGRPAFDPEILPAVIARAGHRGQLEGGPAALSEREREVLQHAARGLTNKQIGAELIISDRTVQNHLQNIFEKLHVRSRTEAVTVGLRDGLIVLEEQPDGSG